MDQTANNEGDLAFERDIHPNQPLQTVQPIQAAHLSEVC